MNQSKIVFVDDDSELRAFMDILRSQDSASFLGMGPEGFDLLLGHPSPFVLDGSLDDDCDEC